MQKFGANARALCCFTDTFIPTWCPEHKSDQLTLSAVAPQEKHEGEEVDFDQSYFFPEWKDPLTLKAEPAQSDFEVELRLAASAA